MIKDYYTKYGLVVPDHGDQGDTALFSGALHTFLGIFPWKDPHTQLDRSDLFVRFTNNLMLPNGIWKRGIGNQWWSNPDTFSRDQTAGVAAALMTYNVASWAKDLYDAWKSRGFLGQNNTSLGLNPKRVFPDVMTPSLYVTLQRTMGNKVSPLWDMCFSVDLYLAEKDQWDYYVAFIPILLANAMKHPTKYSCDVVERINEDDVEKKLIKYFDLIHNVCPEMTDIYLDAIRKAKNHIRGIK